MLVLLKPECIQSGKWLPFCEKLYLIQKYKLELKSVCVTCVGGFVFPKITFCQFQHLSFQHQKEHFMITLYEAILS